MFKNDAATRRIETGSFYRVLCFRRTRFVMNGTGAWSATTVHARTADGKNVYDVSSMCDISVLCREITEIREMIFAQNARLLF